MTIVIKSALPQDLSNPEIAFKRPWATVGLKICVDWGVFLAWFAFCSLVFWQPLHGVWALPPHSVLHSSGLFNIPSNLLSYLSALSSKPWTISPCQRKTPKYGSIHCHISFSPYTAVGKYPFVSHHCKPVFEWLGNTQHKPVWQHFSNSCDSEHPGELSADLYAAQRDIWVCFATVSCQWKKNVRSPLFPGALFSQPLRQWNFPLESEGVARGGKNPFLFSFFCPLPYKALLLLSGKRKAGWQSVWQKESSAAENWVTG